MKSLGIFGLVGYLLFWVIGMVGYILNFVDVVSAAINGAPITTVLVLRTVGLLFVPLGAVLGWL